MNDFAGKLYYTFKEKLKPILLKQCHEIREEERFPSSFYETSIILIPKPDEDTTTKENYRPISLINKDAKILKNISKSNSAIQ